MAQIDQHFPCLSPESATPKSIVRFLIAEELARELDLRRSSYPARVERRKMSQIDADWQLEIMTAIHADFAADVLLFQGHIELFRARRAAADQLLSRFRWTDLIAALQREIALRRKYYPQLVADGRLPAAKACQHLERIEAVHFHYWVHGRRWWPAELDSKRYRAAELTEAEHQIWREAYEVHCARFLPIEEAPRGTYASDVAADGWAA